MSAYTKYDMGIKIIIISENKHKYKGHKRFTRFGTLAYIHGSNSSIIHYINGELHDFYYSISKILVKVVYSEW